MATKSIWTENPTFAEIASGAFKSGQSVEDIATEMGLTVRSVRSKLSSMKVYVSPKKKAAKTPRVAVKPILIQQLLELLGMHEGESYQFKTLTIATLEKLIAKVTTVSEEQA